MCTTVAEKLQKRLRISNTTIILLLSKRNFEEIMKDTGASKLDALNMLFSRYESQKRLEEAVRVRRIIDKGWNPTQKVMRME